MNDKNELEESMKAKKNSKGKKNSKSKNVSGEDCDTKDKLINDKKITNIYKVRQCRNCRTVWNRDVNAGTNTRYSKRTWLE